MAPAGDAARPSTADRAARSVNRVNIKCAGLDFNASFAYRRVVLVKCGKPEGFARRKYSMRVLCVHKFSVLILDIDGSVTRYIPIDKIESFEVGRDELRTYQVLLKCTPPEPDVFAKMIPDLRNSVTQCDRKEVSALLDTIARWGKASFGKTFPRVFYEHNIKRSARLPMSTAPAYSSKEAGLMPARDARRRMEAHTEAAAAAAAATAPPVPPLLPPPNVVATRGISDGAMSKSTATGFGGGKGVSAVVSFNGVGGVGIDVDDLVRLIDARIDKVVDRKLGAFYEQQEMQQEQQQQQQEPGQPRADSLWDQSFGITPLGSPLRAAAFSDRNRSRHGVSPFDTYGAPDAHAMRYLLEEGAPLPERAHPPHHEYWMGFVSRWEAVAAGGKDMLEM